MNRPSQQSRRSISSTLQAAALASCIAALGACAKSVNKSDESALPETTGTPMVRRLPGQPQSTEQSQRSAEFSQAAVDLQEAFDQMNHPAQPGAAPEATPLPAAGAGPNADGRQSRVPAARQPAALAPNLAPIASSAPTPATSSPSATSAGSTAQIISPPTPPTRAELASQLAGHLKPDITAAKEPLKAAMPLIALDSISPGSGSEHLEAISRSVSPSQRRAIQAAQGIVRSLSSADLASADPAALSRTLAAQSESLSPRPLEGTLDLGSVALCSRVESFGKYAPLENPVFLAGKTASMIVYAEIRNFSLARTNVADGASENEAWQVQLAPSVTLYFDADGSKQWSIPETVVREVTRSQRKDFYLVQRVDLPRTLSVGNYNLKLSVRDVTTGGIVERTLPIRVVADLQTGNSSSIRSLNTNSTR